MVSSIITRKISCHSLFYQELWTKFLGTIQYAGMFGIQFFDEIDVPVPAIDTACPMTGAHFY